MSFGNEIGCAVLVPPLVRHGGSVLWRIGGDEQGVRVLFFETGGFVLEIAPENVERVKSIFAARNVEAIEIGKTIEEKKLKMNDIIDINLLEAKERWTNGLREKL